MSAIITARPEDAEFIAWIVAQGMHMDGVPSFLKKHGARDNTLYSWQNTRLYTSYGFVPENTIMFFDTPSRKMSLTI